MIKKKLFITIITIILLSSTVAHSAIVSDNDGSAFVTKAEFDALKQSFNKQVDDYNSSIDGKIDGAIASYLAGINVTKIPINLYDRFINSTAEQPVWYQTVENGSISTSEVNVVGTLMERIKRCNNITAITFKGSSADGYIMIGIFEDLSQFTNNWDTKSIRYVKSGTRNQEFGTMGWTKTNGWNSAKYPPTYDTITYSQQISNITPGSGAKWVYQIKNGRKCLKYYCPSYYVSNNIDYKGLYYMNFDITANQDPYFKDNGKKTTSTLTVQEVVGEPGKTVTAGTEPTDSTATDVSYVKFSTNLQRKTDNNNYLNAFFSLTSNRNIYAQDEEYNGTKAETGDSYIAVDIPDQVFYDIYYNTAGGQIQTNDVSGTKVKYKPVKIDNDTTTQINKFCNNVASIVAGTNVYVGGGMPILQTADDEQTIRVSLKLSCSSGSPVCSVVLADKQLELGTAPTGSTLASGTVVANNTAYVDFNIATKKKDDIVYLFLKNDTNTNPITISDLIIR